MDLWGILIGRRLANREGKARKITALEGVPAMGLDGLGSSAYGPEAALRQSARGSVSVGQYELCRFPQGLPPRRPG
jgi:hypothetical protein